MAERNEFKKRNVRKRPFSREEVRELRKENQLLKTRFIPLLVVTIITSALVLGVMFGKDVTYEFSTDVDTDDYERIELVYDRYGQTHYIPLDMDDGHTSGKLSKNSELKSIKVYQEVDVGIDLYEQFSDNIKENFTFSSSQNKSNILHEDGVLYKNEEQFSVTDSNHYKGVDSFYFDEITPDNWTSSKVKIIDNMGLHDKIAQFDYYGSIERNVTTVDNGTVEFWIYLHPNMDFYARFQQLPCHNEFRFGVTNILKNFHLQIWNGTEWLNESAVSSTEFIPRTWVNIRVDFNCNGSGLIYNNTNEGYYSLYVNDKLVFHDASFVHTVYNVTNMYFEFGALPGPPVIGAFSYMDAIGWNWGNKELNNESYKLGEKDETWDIYHKDIEVALEFTNDTFDLTYKHIKNATVDLLFQTNTTLDPQLKSGMQVYNFMITNWIWMGAVPDIEGNISFSKEYIYPSMVYMNNTRTDGTDVHFKIHTSNLGFDYEFNWDLNVSACFWKEISEFYYTDTESLEYETEISLISDIEIEENEVTIFINVTTTTILSFGSWIYTNISSLVTEVVYIRKIHEFPIEDNSVFTDSFFGLRILEIFIESIDLVEHEIEDTIEYTSFTIY